MFLSASCRSSRRKLIDNAMTVISAVLKAKPSVAKGKYVKGMTISSTMGPACSSIRPYWSWRARFRGSLKKQAHSGA